MKHSKHKRILGFHFKPLTTALICLLILSLLSAVLIFNWQGSLEASESSVINTPSENEDILRFKKISCEEEPCEAPPTTATATQLSPDELKQQALQRRIDDCLIRNGRIGVNASSDITTINCTIPDSYVAPSGRPEGRRTKFDIPVKCWQYSASIDVNQALNLWSGPKELATCIPTGMLRAIRDYPAPHWGYDAHIYNTYRWVLVRRDGGCTNWFDLTYAYDFQIACKAHDYCYDLIRAGLSYPLSEGTCDGTFNRMLDEHCKNRHLLLSALCFLDAELVKRAVAVFANTPQSPGRVHLSPKPVGQIASTQLGSSKCLAFSASPDNVEILQVVNCTDDNKQEFRLEPVNRDRSHRDDLSKYGLFQIQRVVQGVCYRTSPEIEHTTERYYQRISCDDTEEAKRTERKCLQQDFTSTANRIILVACDKSNFFQHFRVVATTSKTDEYYILNTSSNLCLNMVEDAERNDIAMSSCDSIDNQKVWQIIQGMEISDAVMMGVPPEE